LIAAGEKVEFLISRRILSDDERLNYVEATSVAAIGALAGYIAAEAILAPLAHPLHWLIAMIVAVASYFTVLF